MASGINYPEVYKQAENAYLNGNYREAAQIIDQMVQEFPEDPSVLLLRGHIYCYGIEDYEIAKQQYQLVLELTDKKEFQDFAQTGLERIQEILEESEQTQSTIGNFGNPIGEELETAETEHSWLNHSGQPTSQQVSPFNEAFDLEGEESLHSTAQQLSETSSYTQDNPFESSEADRQTEHNWQEMVNTDQGEYPFLESGDFSTNHQSLEESLDEEEAPTFVVSSELQEMPSFGEVFEDIEEEENDTSGSGDNDYSSELDPIDDTMVTNALGRETRDENDLMSEEINSYEEQELEKISEFVTGVSQELPDSGLFEQLEEDAKTVNFDLETVNNTQLPGESSQKKPQENIATNFAGISESISKPQTDVKLGPLAPFFNARIRTKQLIQASVIGVLSALAVMTTGILTSNPKTPETEPPALTATTKLYPFTKSGALVTLAAGLTGFTASFILGELLARELKQYKKDLIYQFSSVCQGDLNAKATIYSEDELGEIASGFNQMIRVIHTTTTEAQRRAEETERDREDLQRQVIRLLDDVEGAARGDLTVKAQVTADVLGAVADAFNLTIENLREIVFQVKQAAEQVHRGSTDSESFARNQSSDALRMAEELAVTLNSVQMLTESIQRVAESAREAEAVARSSSVTALKGGEAVETTVTGILQIRETVSETTRKVKRLAEASQEISKIVALITTISSRTNLLALNASIQAAKAGEAGRGFAIVADEVRQLADRSAKSLREIEQIVLQIQSETGSVMTAMEEGLQQVFDVTEKAEQAKGSLEDIIQVSNRIDALVRSISADTVEQRENSRAVAQVMQSVELTAQETSQESQRVAGSLQNLVSIASNLLSSVERFRVDSKDTA